MAHAPRADRMGNAASKLLSVLTAPAGADLHDAHDIEGYLSRNGQAEWVSGLPSWWR